MYEELKRDYLAMRERNRRLYYRIPSTYDTEPGMTVKDYQFRKRWSEERMRPYYRTIRPKRNTNMHFGVMKKHVAEDKAILR